MQWDLDALAIDELSRVAGRKPCEFTNDRDVTRASLLDSVALPLLNSRNDLWPVSELGRSLMGV